MHNLETYYPGRRGALASAMLRARDVLLKAPVDDPFVGEALRIHFEAMTDYRVAEAEELRALHAQAVASVVRLDTLLTERAAERDWDQALRDVLRAEQREAA